MWLQSREHLRASCIRDHRPGPDQPGEAELAQAGPRGQPQREKGADARGADLSGLAEAGI